MEIAKSKKSRVSANASESSAEQQIAQQQECLPYDIWRMVFKYLNARDMCVGSSVCRMWKDTFETEMSLHGPLYMKSKLEDLASREGQQIVDKLKIKPRMVLCCSESLSAEEDSLFSQEKECICKHLPTSCDIVYAYTYKASVALKAEPENQFPPECVSGCMFFPQLPQEDVKTYSLQDPKKRSGSISTFAKKMATELSHSAQEKSKCVIMFCDPAYAKDMRTLLNGITYRKSEQQSLALIGGLTDFIFLCQKGKENLCRRKIIWAAFSISKPGLQSWSIVISRKCFSKDQIKEKLQTWRDSIQLKKHTAGLMFGCCARIDNVDVETEAFADVFPDVSLMCCYGDGEFGINTLEDVETSAKYRGQLTHQYSTIYLIITYS